MAQLGIPEIRLSFVKADRSRLDELDVLVDPVVPVDPVVTGTGGLLVFADPAGDAICATCGDTWLNWVCVGCTDAAGELPSIAAICVGV
jgi:hypothetical protein